MNGYREYNPVTTEKLLRTLRREIFAAQLKVVLDKKLGRVTSPAVKKLARMTMPPIKARSGGRMRETT